MGKKKARTESLEEINYEFVSRVSLVSVENTSLGVLAGKKRWRTRSFGENYGPGRTNDGKLGPARIIACIGDDRRSFEELSSYTYTDLFFIFRLFEVMPGHLEGIESDFRSKQ